MDITPLFKACVRTVKTRHKAMGKEIIPPDQERSRILASKTKSEFVQKTTELVGYITRLKEFLLEHRKDYVNTNHLISNSGMTDNERNQIDTETQNVIKLCNKKIQELQTQGPVNSSLQLSDHRAAVIALMESYLKNVCKIHCEQRAIRTKRILDAQKFSKLEPKNQATKRAVADVSSHHKTLNDSFSTTGANHGTPSKEKQDVMSANDAALMEEEFSPEEIQMFEQENKKIFEEYNSLASEIRQIEGKVLEISKLQEIFAEKVLEQDKDIEQVSTTVIGTTENIKDANEEIRQAMKKNASFRVWILFFLLVLSFSLLFLDWYNP